MNFMCRWVTNPWFKSNNHKEVSDTVSATTAEGREAERGFLWPLHPRFRYRPNKDEWVAILEIRKDMNRIDIKTDQ